MATQPADQTVPTKSTWSRAFGPGSPVVRVGLAGLALIAAAVVLVAVLSGGGGRAAVVLPPSHSARAVAHRPAYAYGYIPAWLPTAKIPVSRIVTATPAHPWLAIQGDTVEVQLASGHVLATVSGPNTPEQGHFPIPKTTLCTFTVSMTAAKGVIPLDPKHFATIDETGALHTLKVTMLEGGPIPTRVAPGKTVNLVLTAVLPVGDGRVLWAPVPGRPVVQWDFDIEID